MQILTNWNCFSATTLKTGENSFVFLSAKIEGRSLMPPSPRTGAKKSSNTNLRPDDAPPGPQQLCTPGTLPMASSVFGYRGCLFSVIVAVRTGRLQDSRSRPSPHNCRATLPPESGEPWAIQNFSGLPEPPPEVGLPIYLRTRSNMPGRWVFSSNSKLPQMRASYFVTSLQFLLFLCPVTLSLPGNELFPDRKIIIFSVPRTTISPVRKTTIEGR